VLVGGVDFPAGQAGSQREREREREREGRRRNPRTGEAMGLVLWRLHVFRGTRRDARASDVRCHPGR
jgi:hypothetical protein